MSYLDYSKRRATLRHQAKANPGKGRRIQDDLEAQWLKARYTRWHALPPVLRDYYTAPFDRERDAFKAVVDWYPGSIDTLKKNLEQDPRPGCFFPFPREVANERREYLGVDLNALSYEETKELGLEWF